jgi:chromosome segregation protein
VRLTHIKLSGFKSFVDPTTIPVPGQLVAVIGPNGCGKSNVIDAVRWVLGESSAKQLRGESMQDVIFNGSTTRKPVSRASVELVFDNTDTQLTGPWGQYAEVSIKRILTRQGESSYLINNQQVRRRDITDLFLGTGVGARGYAVIEQGMISRIIEARPEELRVYLEEAAGVSRYKERRRETENRLADTRDNLSRVDDLRQELERQVERLAEQATVAAQYHDLRGALSHKQNLLALARREEAARDEAGARVELARLESEEARLGQAVTELEAELECVRDSHFSSGDLVLAAQQQVFDTNAQLARREEQQRHRQESRTRVTRELESARNERAMLVEGQSRILDERAEWQEQREELQMQMEEVQLRLEGESDRLPDAEAGLQVQDQRQSLLAGQMSERTRQRDLALQRVEHLRHAGVQGRARAEALSQELTALNLPTPDAVSQAAQVRAEAEAALASVRGRVVADEAKQADLASEREKLDERLTRERGALAQAQALAAARAVLLSRERGGAALEAWVEEQALGSAPQLWQSLRVNEHWRVALEAVLAERLLARAAVLPLHSPPGALLLVDGGRIARSATGRGPMLCDQVEADAPFDAALSDWLAHVYLADTLEQALAARGTLAAGEIWVTPEGHRVSAVSVSYYGVSAGDGLMEQKAELESAQQQVSLLEPEVARLEQQRAALGGQMSMLAEAVRGQKTALTRLDGELNAATLAHVRLDQAARQGGARRAAILAEQQQLADQALSAEEQMLVAEETIEATAIELETLSEQVDAVRHARQQVQSEVQQLREQARASEQSMHAVRLRLQAAEQKVVELTLRDQERIERDEILAERLALLVAEADSLEQDVPEEAVQELLLERERLDAALSAARDQQNALAMRMRTLSTQQHEVNAALPALREARQACLLRHQEARLSMDRYAEELLQAGVDEAALLADLTDAVKPAALVSEIARLARAVEGLGAVNLAALDELQQARQRGEYLTAQSDDLLAAMATLENAILKIDGESRAMLQDTFDAVNAKMSEIFPTLFGGGRAELVLTGEDLLDAGVQIVAQPPGKKNSTIHLLSGGEKALTAMSLVFSLFSLNPAPFCLLDEVDAPLDDANTSRFCDLVKQMSLRTQFLYISHNRLTMEMAEQLVGVTMQEQGVSRVVAVDIVEALQLREPA